MKKNNRKLSKIVAASCLAAFSLSTIANAGGHEGQMYGPFPITLKGYSGDKTNSVSYSGQIARHALHDSLKKLSSTGDGGANAGAVKAEMMAYFGGSEKNKAIIAPADKGDFNIKQETMNELSKGKNLSGKSYKGVMNAWPGQMTGAEVLESMISKAAETSGGFDPDTGYNYTQLISKFAMGAVFYNQAVDGYLDEKLSKPNSKPYKDGAYYTGLEHVWDEAWGYWGASANCLNLTAQQSYDIAKMKDMGAADTNKDGMVDLKSEYVFAHAYYASAFDKGGKTSYLHDICEAFLHGRQLITSADGADFTTAQMDELKGHVDVIASNWEKVIAEAVFKYAGSVYKDIGKLEEAMDSGSDTGKLFKTYAKHWGELKGFAMAIQSGKNNLGETAVKMNRMMGFGPVLMNSSQVVGMNSQGQFIKEESSGWGEYKLHMLKIQKLMVDTFGVKARANDMISDMADLAAKLGDSDSAEND